MSKILLNSDLGESFGVYVMEHEKDIMTLIDMANIACGFHAGDPLTLQKTLKLAKQSGVMIGAHPSYPDLVGFGRRSLACSPQEIESFVVYQCGALRALAKIHNTDISYVKPHGALYNDMMKKSDIFLAIVRAISQYDNNLKLMILSTPDNALYQSLADKHGVSLLFEVFADRGYTNEGFLVPRSEKGALLHSSKEAVSRLNTLINDGFLYSIEKTKLYLQADSLCVHGDNKEALNLVKALRSHLDHEV